MTDGSIAAQLLLQAALIALNAIFACAEIAVLSVNDAKTQKLAAAGDKRALRLKRLTNEPARFLATIQVAITLSGFLGSAFAADNFAQRLVGWLMTIGVRIPKATLDTIAVVLITLLLSFFTLVFGELVPKRVAMRKAEALALGLSGLVSGISVAFKPIVTLLTLSTNAMLRLMRIDPEAKEEQVTEEEIRLMVDAGSENGAIDATEKQIIQNVFAFDDMPASEIATHRTEVSMLWRDETPADWERTISQSRHAMYPMCGETADDVLGVVSAKDYFRLPDRGRESVMGIVAPAFFVPEGVKADVLFRNMRRKRNRIAIVLDEFGGFEGVVTINDLLEKLVGDLEYEDDPVEEAESDIERIDSKTWRVSGSASLDDVSEKLGVKLPTDEYDTFGGFVFGCLGAVPDDGTECEVDACDLHVRVLSVQAHKLEKAIVTPIE